MKRPMMFAAKKKGGAPKADPKKKAPTPDQLAMVRKKNVKAADRRPRNKGRS